MAATVLTGDQADRSADRPDSLSAGRSSLRAVLERLCVPVDIASLVVFRIAFGAIMLTEIWKNFSYGWIRVYYVEPTNHFTYFLFDWVRPWPGGWPLFPTSTTALRTRMMNDNVAPGRDLYRWCLQG